MVEIREPKRWTRIGNWNGTFDRDLKRFNPRFAKTTLPYENFLKREVNMYSLFDSSEEPYILCISAFNFKTKPFPYRPLVMGMCSYSSCRNQQVLNDFEEKMSIKLEKADNCMVLREMIEIVPMESILDFYVKRHNNGDNPYM